MKKFPVLMMLLMVSAAFMPRAAIGGESYVDTNTHGLLLECDDRTRENHLYLMNAKKLGLSMEQIAQLRDIKGECNKFCVIEKARLRIAKMELDELLGSENLDMEKVEEKIRYISELQNELRIRHVKTRVEAMMILTEEQKDEASTLSR